MAEKTIKVVFDTNVIVSALVFGGKPEKVLKLALEKKILVTISPFLLLELRETLIKKFYFSLKRISSIETKLKNAFSVVNPPRQLNIVKDIDDNRVLEAAIEGSCDYIVTGDKELLELGSFKNINILPPDIFLKILKNN